MLQKLTKNELSITFPLRFLLGLAGVTTLAAFASLIIRINWEFQLLLVVGAFLIYLFVLRKNIPPLKFSFTEFNLAQKVGVLFLAACLIITFYQAVQVPANPDTGIYHAQSIHWIETYPAIPGLGNLHQRLAYNSSWLLANAVFSFSFLNIESFHLLSGFLFLTVQIYFYQGIHQLLARKFTLSNFLRLGFFLSTYIFLFDQVSSPGTDSPTTLYIWLIVSSILTLLEKKTALSEDIEAFELCMICVFCFTIKMSAAPILLFPLIWWTTLLVKRNYKKAGISAFLAVMIVLPFLIRNVIQTGYPFYPGFPVDLFHFDWAIPLVSVKEESRVIHWFAMLPNTSIEEFLSMSFRDQTLSWFYNLIPRQKAILLSIPIGLCLNLILFVFRPWRKFISENSKILVVYLVCFLGCVFWFFSAPTMRFGFSFLFPTIFISIFSVAVFILPRFTKIQGLVKWMIVFGCIGLIAINMRSTLKFDQLNATLLIPADYPQWSSQPCEFKNFKLLCQAGYDSCWYSPFPCAIHGNIDVEMRGTDYRDGFRNVH